MQGGVWGLSPLLSILPPFHHITNALRSDAVPLPGRVLGASCVRASGEREEERGAPQPYACLGASWEERKVSSSERLCSLLDVFEKRGPGVHHRFEGVLAAGSHALIGVEQHGQLPIGFVHFVPRRHDKSEGTHTTHSPAQPRPGWQSTVGSGAPPCAKHPCVDTFEPLLCWHQGPPGFGGDAMGKELKKSTQGTFWCGMRRGGG